MRKTILSKVLNSLSLNVDKPLKIQIPIFGDPYGEFAHPGQWDKPVVQEPIVLRSYQKEMIDSIWSDSSPIARYKRNALSGAIRSSDIENPFIEALREKIYQDFKKNQYELAWATQQGIKIVDEAHYPITLGK